MHLLQLATAATATALPRQVRVRDWYRAPVWSIRTSCSSSAALPGLDEQFMRLALQQAQAAFDADEVPIGAVLVDGSEVVSTGHNATETRRNPLAHAELQCILTAAESRQAWRLQDATLYCTVEPCPMCAGAILQARLQRLVYGARQPRLGADGSWVALFPPQAAVPVKGQQNEAPGLHKVDTPATEATNHTAPGRCSACATQSLPVPLADAESATATANALAASVGLSHVHLTQPIQPNGSHPFHPDILVTRGVLEEECRELMVKFFRKKRQQAKEAKAAAAAAAAEADLGSSVIDSVGSSGLLSSDAGDAVKQQRALYLGSQSSDSDSDIEAS